MAAFGKFGSTTSSLTESGFFKWFSLERSTEPAGAEDAVYRPSAPAFRELTALVARADARGHLQALRLQVARSFIADPRQGAFARDIVKSFLADVSGQDAGRLASLVDEIFFRDPVGPVLMRGPGPSLPAELTPGYLAFVGRSPSWEITLSAVKLTLENTPLAGEPYLTVRAERIAGKREGWLSKLWPRR